MNIVSRSPLRYFQKKGHGRYGARDYDHIGHTDPFRYGQVCLHPRFGEKVTNVERRISKPCEVVAKLREYY